MRLVSRLLALALTLMASPAVAGIADSPLPELVAGETTLHLYSVPGVMNVAGLGTFFSCTSTDSATMQVGVETFGSGGVAPSNDAVATSLSVNPGRTVTFGTSVAFGIPLSSDLAVGSPGPGSARILSTSKKLVCTAYIADVGNAPPTSAWQLTIIAKTKQKAAN